MSATIPPFETIDILPLLGMRICPADCKIVKGNVPSYCPNADPPIPEAFLPDVENAFYRFPSLLPPGHTIHWIGRRAWQRNLCRCNAAPAADTGREQAGTGNAEGKANVGREQAGTTTPEGGKPKRRQTKPPLEKREPLKFQIYDRIRREHQAGMRRADIPNQLKTDKDFVEQVRAAKLALNRKLVKNALAFFSQPKRKKQESPPT